MTQTVTYDVRLFEHANAMQMFEINASKISEVFAMRDEVNIELYNVKTGNFVLFKYLTPVYDRFGDIIEWRLYPSEWTKTRFPKMEQYRVVIINDLSNEEMNKLSSVDAYNYPEAFYDEIYDEEYQ